MSELWQLFWIFFRIGALTFGGGYAMLPILQKEIVDGRKWVTEEKILDYYAIGQSTPGIIAINTAIFIGHARKGIAGAITAALGVALPSLLIITAIASVIPIIRNIPVIDHAFAGVRIAVAALIVTAVMNIWKAAIKDTAGMLIFALAAGSVLLLRISPIIVIVAAAAWGATRSIRAQSGDSTILDKGDRRQ